MKKNANVIKPQLCKNNKIKKIIKSMINAINV